MTADLQLSTRAALLERAAVDKDARTVRATLSTETPVRRWDAQEVLRHEAGAVDLRRAEGGLPLLWSHDRTAPIGIVENVRLDGRRLVGLLRFGGNAKADEVLKDVADGVLRHVSIGYQVHEWETAPDGALVAKRWEIFEASVVAVPADTAAQIGRAADPPPSNGATTVDPKSQQQPSPPDLALTRAADITELCARHGVAHLAAGLIRSNSTVDAARAAVLQELAVRDAASGGHLNVHPTMHRASPAADAREQMIEALAARMGGPTAARENPYRHVRVVDMAREVLERHGLRTSGLSPSDLIERAGMHVSGDFPELLTSAGQRVLRQAYSAYEGGVRQVFRSSTARDFRAKAKLMLGEMPELLKVNEHGEYKFGSTAESAASYRLDTYGRIFALARQALVNDDLSAFADANARFGRAAVEFESKFLVDLLASNPTMPDSFALFHANHGNLGTGTGSALSLTSLSAARLRMRLQTGLDGKTPIDAAPRWLIVPAALENLAYQLTSSNYVPTVAADANEFRPGGRAALEVVVDPRLDAHSATAWYLAADAGLVDTIEYSYLEGEQGPVVTTREGFEVDGLQIRVRLDFGAGVIDHRGLYRANGA